ncbi:UbiA family prenyltransferase [Pelagicoccus sp. SDUM812005]|uniref:UbiA family prenyltransferase n=1 Tax=Pelagicoccus sp. SDUM812005 TaxID=3041257 RepID=UPI00280E938E|nr:UbiA family prenyltransferase [Pelagicoccus sp. SDUM812005]MDQ8179997.1 UbiA family prenyltransferase [Pelagicoccus sp. SDUM812005]
MRTHLTLARASNLPTVWSNILCAWIIVGGYNNLQLASYLLGASLLYIGGMYLNDYCDREIDAQQRPERPIPSGQISAPAVRNIAAALLALGFAAIAWTGLLNDPGLTRWLPAAFAAGVVASVVLYDSNHKGNPIAPIFMAACRALLYLAVASAFANGIDTNNLIATGTIFVFVLGITFLARTEATTNEIDYPALAMIAAPVLGAFYYSRHGFTAEQTAALALFLVWIARSFLRARVGGKLIIGKTIGPLLASIPLLDLLILATLGLATQPHLVLFAVLFALTTAAQRFIPAS